MYRPTCCEPQQMSMIGWHDWDELHRFCLKHVYSWCFSFVNCTQHAILVSEVALCFHWAKQLMIEKNSPATAKRFGFGRLAMALRHLERYLEEPRVGFQLLDCLNRKCLHQRHHWCKQCEKHCNSNAGKAVGEARHRYCSQRVRQRLSFGLPIEAWSLAG